MKKPEIERQEIADTFAEWSMAMSNVTRRTLLQLSTGTIISGIVLPSGKGISAEQRKLFTDAVSESMVTGWKLLSSVSPAQVTAFGNAQLSVLQQSYNILSPATLAKFYASLYRLIGISLHNQGRYAEAEQTHLKSYTAAKEDGDMWEAMESLICLTHEYHVSGRHLQAIQVIQNVLQLVGMPTDEVLIRSKAHLLGRWADHAIAIDDIVTAQAKLADAALLLDQIEPDEEFDHISWLQLAGTAVLSVGDYKTAIKQYKQALTKLPLASFHRRASISLSLAVAYVGDGERDASLLLAEQTVPMVRMLNVDGLHKQLAEYIQRALLVAFPHDVQVRTFVSDTVQQIPALQLHMTLS